MFPWRSSQCRHGFCAVDEKQNQTKTSYCSQLAFVLVTFYLFCPCLGTSPWQAPLAPGRCLQWLDGGCSSGLGSASYLQVPSNGGQLSCTFPPGTLYDWRMRKVWVMWKRAKCACEGKEEPQKGQRMESVEVSVGYCLCCSGRGNTTVKKKR